MEYGITEEVNFDFMHFSLQKAILFVLLFANVISTH